MKHRYFLIIASLIVIIFTASATAAPIVVPPYNDNGNYTNTAAGDRSTTWMDWSAGYIYSYVSLNSATFESLTAAKRAVLLHAADNLSNFMINFPLRANHTVADLADNNNNLMTKIRRLADTSAVFDTQISDDGICSAICGVKLSGYNSYISTVLSIFADYQPLPWPQPTAQSTPSLYSGVVIDARGLSVTPCMLITIKTATSEIYSYKYISYNNLVANATAAYCGFADINKLNERVGNNPLIVKAISSENNGTAFIISDNDAQQILTLQKNNNILSECLVVIAN